MKNLEEIKKHLDSLEGSRFAFNPNEIEQGSDEWHYMKLGVISASTIGATLAGKKTATRNTHMCNLVAQILTKEAPKAKAAPLEWGKENELAAQSAFEFATGLKVHDLPFIYKDDSLRVGCSPDGYGDVGLELKCPYTSAVFVDFKCNGNIKPEYIKQCRFSAWVTGRESWEFASFDPRITTDNFHIVTVNQCDKFVKELEEKVPEFISDMDKMLSVAGVEFGYQWE